MQKEDVNGIVVRGIASVLKDQVEAYGGVKIQGKHNIVQWLVRLAVMVPSNFLLRKQGKTMFEKNRQTV